MTLGKHHPVIATAQALVQVAYGNADIEEGIYVNVYQKEDNIFARYSTIYFDLDDLDGEDSADPLLLADLSLLLGVQSYPAATFFVQQVAGLLNMEHDDDAVGWLPYERLDREGQVVEEGFQRAYKGDVSVLDDRICWFAHGPGYLMHLIDTMGSLCGDLIDIDLHIWPAPTTEVADTFVTRPVCPACLDIHRSRLSP